MFRRYIDVCAYTIAFYVNFYNGEWGRASAFTFQNIDVSENQSPKASRGGAKDAENGASLADCAGAHYLFFFIL